MATDALWDGSPSHFTPAQWARARLLDRGVGDPLSKQRYALPVRTPSGELSRKALAAAAARLNQVLGVSADQRAALARKLIALYHQADMAVPSHLDSMAHRCADTGSVERRNTPGRVESRGANGRQIGG